MSPAVVNETVKVARDFLRKTSTHGAVRDMDWERKRVAKFLEWEDHKVMNALAALSDIEGGERLHCDEGFSASARARPREGCEGLSKRASRRDERPNLRACAQA